jgi:hypothetical protein
LMTFGVGAMSAGAMIEPAAATVAEVQADAGVAMAGMIPADYPLPDVIALSRRQSLLRRAFVALGLILVVVCPMLAIWGVTGISS